jgi:hypothetical protein
VRVVSAASTGQAARIDVDRKAETRRRLTRAIRHSFPLEEVETKSYQAGRSGNYANGADTAKQLFEKIVDV